MDHGRGMRPGSVVGGVWRIERKLGEGGFAVTYEAQNIKTGARSALKEFMPAGCCSREPGTSHITAAPGPEGDVFRWGRERFIREGETLARLDHSSIVRVRESFEANGTAYMALDFETGGTLKDWLGRLGRLPTQAELDRLLWPLLEALTQVHSLLLLHRDIKPENILLRDDGTPVLIDFGAVRSAVATHTQSVGSASPVASSAFAVVSHGYSPPEQYDPTARMVGTVSDIYGLAATLYFALTGAPPPAAPSRQFADPLVALASSSDLAGKGYRAAFLAAIDHALALDPRQRPQSAVEFRRALGVTEPTRPPQPAPRPAPVAPPPRPAPQPAPSATAPTVVGRPVPTPPTDGAPIPPPAQPRGGSNAPVVIAAVVAFVVATAGGWWALVEAPRRAEAIRVEQDVREAGQRKAESDKRQRLEAERQAEERRKAEEDERIRAERLAEERKKAEAERQRMLEENQAREARRAEEDRRRIQAEKQAEDQRKAEEERQRLAAEKQAEERRRQEEERRKAEEDRRRALAEKQAAERRAAEKEAEARRKAEKEAEDRRKASKPKPEPEKRVATPSGDPSSCLRKAKSMWIGGAWGAVAVGDNNCGFSWGYNQRALAEARAMDECRKRTSNCRIVATHPN